MYMYIYMYVLYMYYKGSSRSWCCVLKWLLLTDIYHSWCSRKKGCLFDVINGHL